MYRNMTPKRALKELEDLLQEKLLQWNLGDKEPNLFVIEAQQAMQCLECLDVFLTGKMDLRSTVDVILLKKLIRVDISEWEMKLSDGISSLLFRLETKGECHIRLHMHNTTQTAVKWMSLDS